MKNIVLLLLVLFTVLTLTSNRSGRTTRTGVAVTAAPGESGQYCGSFGCHFNGQFDPDVKISLLNENGDDVTSYIPNKTYTVNMKIDHTGTPAGYGFQIVSLLDSDETGINTWTDLSDQMQEVIVGDRQYIEQNTVLFSDIIQLSWTAPDTGSGPISIYGVGNAVNGNGNSAGDGSDTSFLKVTEGIMSSLNDLSFLDIDIYPNPTSDFINIKSDLNLTSASIYNINGQLLKYNTNLIETMDLTDLESGIYIVKIQLENGQFLSRKLSLL